MEQIISMVRNFWGRLDQKKGGTLHRLRIYLQRLKSPQAASIVWYGTYNMVLRSTDNTFIVTICQQSTEDSHFSEWSCQDMFPKFYIDVSTTQFYSCKLFLTACFSQKFKKPSEKIPMEHLLFYDTIRQPIVHLSRKVRLTFLVWSLVSLLSQEDRIT